MTTFVAPTMIKRFGQKLREEEKIVRVRTDITQR
jgi:hypothetical protein